MSTKCMDANTILTILISNTLKSRPAHRPILETNIQYFYLVFGSIYTLIFGDLWDHFGPQSRSQKWFQAP